MSLGLDTSVILRLLTGQPAAESRVARERLERAHLEGEPVTVTDLVLAEAYFALCHHYAVARDQARERLAAMASSGALTVVPPGAVDALAKATGAGLVDRLIHARHRAAGLLTVTFDRKMGALDGAVRLGRR